MSQQFKDYYKTLGVAEDAGADVIKKAFRKLARKFHPDVAVEIPDAEDQFKEINEAYEVLGDPEKRRQYDAMRADPTPASGDWSRSDMPPDFEFEGTGFSDFFERYFGGSAERRHAADFGGGRGGFHAPRRGHDIEGDLMVTLQEAMLGAMRTLSLRSVDPVSGQPTQSEVQVRIPAGIREGQRLRVAGHGAPGPGGGKAGDLFLRVRLAADPDYRTRGHDLYRDLALSPWEAVLGTEIPLRLPGGRTVTVKIPAGTQSGDQLRLKGYGLPRRNAPGDLYVVINIEVPGETTSEERSLWQKMRDLSPFQPRAS